MCQTPKKETQDRQGDRLISLRDVYVGLWKCRDFELSHLWQWSVFLVTFLVLVFTGYGKLLEFYFSRDSTPGGPHSLGVIQFHGMAVGLSCAGLFVSTLWVCMAKGSAMLRNMSWPRERSGLC